MSVHDLIRNQAQQALGPAYLVKFKTKSPFKVETIDWYNTDAPHAFHCLSEN